ncbi:HAD hydrolase-like protein [Secundilactobacillus silagei]|uniref:Phosphatase n=2 Tax=Secundilactobacillus silagei TaxID=1293415 RepID=A0A1Z5IGF6_9LACO|nr:HAD hydrolase-like protein [Secundilactobacillus silagei]TDG73486.1 hypothetical protein C5L25_000635 [Secundilactobacillus silagei JCM 19001]GAX00857.1 putative phosphatase [Secundilactobacillus silagei JCM 19001]
MDDQVFFDFDGTIVDSERGIVAAVKKMVTVMQLPRLTDAQYRLFIGPTLTVSLKRFFPTLSQEQVTAAVKQYQKEYDTKGLYQLDVYPGIEAALTTLKSAGYQLNVASAKPEWVLRRIIDKFQLNTYFNGIYGATSDERVRSSKTAILAYGIEKSGASRSRSVMVGDRYTDMAGGNANQVKTLGVTYGFGDVAELRSSNATALVASPAELPAGVAKLLRV